jgi:hypothetical protein
MNPTFWLLLIVDLLSESSILLGPVGDPNG